MKIISALAAVGLLAWSANATGITDGVTVPGAAGVTARTGAPEQFDAPQRSVLSVTFHPDGQALVTATLPDSTLLSLALTVGKDLLFDDSLPGPASPGLVPNSNENLSRSSDAIPGFISAATVPPNATVATGLNGWERRDSVLLAVDANGAIGAAKSDLASTIVSAPKADSNPSLTNEDVADDIRAMPDGPLPWWVTLGGLSVLFWWTAQSKKRTLALK